MSAVVVLQIKALVDCYNNLVSDEENKISLSRYLDNLIEIRDKCQELFNSLDTRREELIMEANKLMTYKPEVLRLLQKINLEITCLKRSMATDKPLGYVKAQQQIKVISETSSRLNIFQTNLDKFDTIRNA